MKKLIIASTRISDVSNLAMIGRVEFHRNGDDWVYLTQTSGENLYEYDTTLYNKIQRFFFGTRDTYDADAAVLLMEDDFYNCVGYPSLACDMETIINSIKNFLTWCKEIEQYQEDF